MSRFPQELIRMAVTGNMSASTSHISDGEAGSRTNLTERDLLKQVATYGLQYQAGYLPNTLSILPLSDHAPRLATHPCQRTAQQHLLRMLNGEHSQLLSLWLDMLQDHHQHIPEEMIPTALSYGADHRKHQAQLAQALGERGQWLAKRAKNPDWNWILEDKPTLDNAENTYKAWQKAFERWLQRDRDSALASLRRHWDDLDPLMQTVLLQTLPANCSERDVAFLWDLFEDPVTRFAAATCMFEIKEAPFAQAMREVIERIIVMKESPQPVIDFAWSPLFDGDSRQITRDEAEALCTIMGYRFNPDMLLMIIPLSYWYETYQLSPKALVKATQNSTRATTFYYTWSHKAHRDHDTDFLFALVMHSEYTPQEHLLEQLSNTQLMQASLHWLKHKPLLGKNHPVINLLKRIKQTWDETLAQVFIDSIQTTLESAEDAHVVAELLTCHAPLMPLSTDTRLEKILLRYRNQNLTEATANDILEILAFRAEMLQALQTV